MAKLVYAIANPVSSHLVLDCPSESVLSAALGCCM
jgi:hypothetical protein